MVDKRSKKPEQTSDELTTEAKALKLNLDNSIYGAIVEIGAGQEVARELFNAGAAAGTVAKTMSAYDMKVSDDVYGKAGRYVSQERVSQMLQHEYELLIKRLTGTRDIETTYFSYAATVTARSFSQKNECHGWIGVRMQLEPNGPAHEIYLHVRMLDDTNRKQSEALGILGVNLIYGAFHLHQNPTKLIDSLQDNLGSFDRIEIDVINFSGPNFEKFENRLMNLHLIKSWSCRAVMFDTSGKTIVPASALRKKDAIVIRGSFKPPTKAHMDMKEAAYKHFLQEEGVEGDKVLVVAEITMNELTGQGEVDAEDFLARVDLLNQLGFSVLISDYFRFFSLRSWIRRYTQNRIGIVLSVLDFDNLFDESYYEGLEGGILEALGKLLSDNTFVYVYPSIKDNKLITLDNVKINYDLRYLLRHLIVNKKMVSADVINVANLGISSRDIAKKIASGEDGWQNQLPDSVTEAIIDKGMFGYTKK